ncbi:hypothetical protein HN371_09040 [Candidatus Poribacteria bacterium]|jgi:diacylglycerol kinase (CTP)|nr:hypothetical protein [Candidatus Poribacteria bacterium]MBT5535733.1 hypothetical protein [Candidatus Poribacteria bacterium]MBT5712440.1 hypothetical protein [Candidatus Poribacteria bacterium]MBT7804489.1 hypothetical protein [Candidatus Poribacteria bacterium]
MLRLRRLVRELRRKGFHFSGLVIPVLYYLGLRVPIPGADGPWLTRELAIWIVGAGAAIYLVTDMTRLSDPSMNRRFVRVFRVLLRPSEVRAPTGTSYYLLGAFLSILLFSPVVAIAAILFLVFGDFTAALVGTSVGRIRIFPPRTLEGSAGCLLACLAVGIALFWHVKPVWPVAVALAFVGAAAATVAEGAPWRLNDNLTIPLVSGLALRFAARGLGVVELPLPW